MNYDQYMYQMPMPFPTPVVNYTPRPNYILCEIYINKSDRNNDIKIINSYEEYCRTYDFEIIDDLRNEEKNCTIYRWKIQTIFILSFFSKIWKSKSKLCI